MSDRFPDIEIYIKRPELSDVIAWLERRFGSANLASLKKETDDEALVCRLGAEDIECVIVPNAVKGGYMSVWFKSTDTPWPSDRDCALEALSEFGLEVRCSAGSWEEGSDNGGWLRITPNGETKVNWL